MTTTTKYNVFGLIAIRRDSIQMVASYHTDKQRTTRFDEPVSLAQLSDGETIYLAFGAAA